MKLCNRISLACLFWISACAGYAKTRDLQQLNAKPRKLEQGLQQDEQTIQDSKKQLAKVEASHNTHGSPLVSPTPQASTVPAPQLATEYIDHRTLTREELLSSSENRPFFDANQAMQTTTAIRSSLSGRDGLEARL